MSCENVFVNCFSSPIRSYFSVAASFFKAKLYKRYTPNCHYMYLQMSDCTTDSRHETITYKTAIFIAIKQYDIAAKALRNSVTVSVLLKLCINIFKLYLMYTMLTMVIITSLNAIYDSQTRSSIEFHTANFLRLLDSES